jgi:hypothetical protein
MVNTFTPISARTAAWYPVPVPISKSFSPFDTPVWKIIRAITEGAEVGRSGQVGSALSVYAQGLVTLVYEKVPGHVPYCTEDGRVPVTVRKVLNPPVFQQGDVFPVVPVVVFRKYELPGHVASLLFGDPAGS